ncbi:hypothetical protein ACQP00_22000 [Dactylosporangium sp. CS-047395]|uniref:hypothetical protein n=1 Tax=Dactylosporangium sp. CS-047395 TaxID=3239936 RepID=UPI003D8D2659
MLRTGLAGLPVERPAAAPPDSGGANAAPPEQRRPVAGLAALIGAALAVAVFVVASGMRGRTGGAGRR